MPLGVDAFRPGADDSAVLDMRAAVWGSDHPHGTAGFFEWLFRRNPLGAGGGSLLRHDGKVIAFAGLVPRQAQIGGMLMPVAHGLDFMVDPSRRGRGLSGSYAIRIVDHWIGSAAAAGYAFAVSFPNSNSVRLLTSGRLGWQPIVVPRFHVRPLPGIRFTAEVPAGLSPGLATHAARILALGLSLARRPPGAGRARFLRLHEFDGRFDDLWERASGPGAPAAFVRDASSLTWRYVGHPVYRYRIDVVEREGEIAAYAISSPRRLMGLDSLLVVDGLAAPADMPLLAALLGHVARQAAAEGVHILGSQAAAGSGFETALRRAGFVAVPARFNPKPFVLAARPLQDTAILAPRPWHLTWGDMDVV